MAHNAAQVQAVKSMYVDTDADGEPTIWLPSGTPGADRALARRSEMDPIVWALATIHLVFTETAREAVGDAENDMDSAMREAFQIGDYAPGFDWTNWCGQFVGE